MVSGIKQGPFLHLLLFQLNINDLNLILVNADACPLAIENGRMSFFLYTNIDVTTCVVHPVIRPLTERLILDKPFYNSNNYYVGILPLW